MTEIETGLQRLGILEVVRDTLKNPDATATDIVAAVQMHLKHRSIPAPTAPKVLNEKKGSVCAILECRSEGLAVEVAKLLQGDVGDYRGHCSGDMWGVFTDVSTILHGKFVYAAGRGRLSTVYHALFRWVISEHMKMALVGVIPGPLPADVNSYEAIQNDTHALGSDAISTRLLRNLVTTYLNECPTKSYTKDFLEHIASVCQLTDYTQGAVQWVSRQLLENVPVDGADIGRYVSALVACCENYVSSLTLPQGTTSINFPARVIQHLVYYNQMCCVTTGKNDRASAVTNMSLD